MVTARNIFKKGDTIHFITAELAAEAADTLCNLGYEWEFLFEKDGQKGIWIQILGNENDKEAENDKEQNSGDF